MRRVAMAGVMGMLVLTLRISGAAAERAGDLMVFMLTAAAVTQPTAPGAFETLSPGDQKMARALYEAQKSVKAPRRPLTLDQIGARRQSGQGWGEVFNTMKSQRLVQTKNLGQVVADHTRPVATGQGDRR